MVKLCGMSDAVNVIFTRSFLLTLMLDGEKAYWLPPTVNSRVVPCSWAADETRNSTDATSVVKTSPCRARIVFPPIPLDVRTAQMGGSRAGGRLTNRPYDYSFRAGSAAGGAR